MISDNDPSLTSAGKPPSLKKILEKSQHVEEKMANCAVELSTINKTVKTEIAAGNTLQQVEKTLTQNENVGKKIIECVDELHQVNEALAQEIDGRDELNRELMEAGQKLAATHDILFNTRDEMAIAHKLAEEASQATGAQMTYQASHDALTGLINRCEFERRLEYALQASKQDPKVHTLLYLDLDQFKIVNDTCGHLAGDELLKQLTIVLQARLRKNDTLARLGGDEFGILLESCATEPALRVADLLRQTVCEFHFVWKDKVFQLGLSLGLVTFSDGKETLADILRMADAACYLAKDRGRNRVQIYTAEDARLAQRHGEMGWVEGIQKALKEKRFVLYSQKILRLVDTPEDGDHYEMLLRMKDEAGTLVPPMAFIPAAERYGPMPHLDRWVISTAFAQYKGRHPLGHPVGTCAINLSGASICDENFYEFVAEQLDRYKVPPEGISVLKLLKPPQLRT